jgi:signal peptidase I
MVVAGIAKMRKRTVSKLISRGADALICIFLLLLAWVVVQVVFVAWFTIPSDSMTPTVRPGDRIAVNKLVAGGRIFNMYRPLRRERFSVYRLPGFGKLRRDDAVVFNFPHRHDWDSVGMDMNIYYLKRLVALPGDTVEIRNGMTYVREWSENPSDPGAGAGKITHGYIPGQRRMMEMISRYARTEPDTLKWPIVMRAFPNDSAVNWTVSEFGPLFIPGKGMTIPLTARNALIYGRYIEYETGEKLRQHNSGTYFINGIGKVSEYTFRENYYFTQGDNSSDSRDSRYWGLLPEHCIVGKAAIIWDSKSKTTGERRWERIGRNLAL